MKEIKVYKTAKPIDNTRVSVYNEVKKYNPYHGADGRFASANGMKAGGSFALPKNSKNLKNATIPEGVRVFSGQGAKGKRAVTTSIGATIENGKVTGGASKPETTETNKPQSLTEKYPLDTSKKVSSPDELFDRMTKDVDWNDPNSQSYKDVEYMVVEGGGKFWYPPHIILDQLGYLDKPIKVSKEEFEELVKQSPYGEIKRGFSSGRGAKKAQQYMKDFTDGDARPNTSKFMTPYGQGWYFAFGRGKDQVAEKRATVKGEKGTILNAVLHPNAKVLNYKSHMSDLDNDRKTLKAKHPKGTQLKKDLKSEFEKLYITDRERSNYVALKGYDAVVISTSQENTLLVLNRGALMIEK